MDVIVREIYVPVQEQQPSKELANLDCLRAFAVLSVLVGHILKWFALDGGAAPAVWIDTLGRTGVLAFFVHTSLVLMFSLERLSRFPEHITLRFYLRRAFRIYPLSILCVVGVLLLKIPEWPAPGFTFYVPSTKVIVANLLLFQNLVGHYSVSGPLWSLPYEVQMYLALPFCFFVFGRKTKGLTYLWLTWLLFACVGAVVKHFTGHANLLGFIPCFLAGVLAYTLRHRIRPRLATVVWPVFLCLWFGVFTAVQARWLVAQMHVGFLACFLLGLSIYYFRDSRYAVWNHLTRSIAKYSYGIYLGHLPMLWLVFTVWGMKNPVLGTTVWLIMTGLLAVLSYHLLEEPLIEVGRRLSARSERPLGKPSKMESGTLAVNNG